MSLARAGTGRTGPGGIEDPGGAEAGKLAARVARRIEAQVVARGWPVGACLGSEPDLRERHGVSRSVLREAVRLVEHHQVGRMRRGPNGGLFVTAPDAGPAARAVVIYLEHVGTSVDDLLEARRLLEPLAAGLAADRISEDGIALVRRTLDEEAGDAAGDGRPPEALHVVLGELSANPVLRLFIEVLVRLTARYAGPFEPSRRRFQVALTESRRFHAQMADAVIAGDSGRAESRTGEYLEGTLTWMRAHGGPGTAARAGTAAAGAADSRDKLAEVIAGRLRDDIAADGWPVGAVVGSEADLLARYGVSRAVLREAIRLLESHKIARMRRGPGGGLVVGVPDPSASVETMALYLEFLRVSATDLLPVREALELGIVARVSARSAEAGLADRLDRAVRWAHEGPADEPDRADRFHTELAELAGNPVLALFVGILTELWSRHTPAGRSTDAPEAVAAVEEVHRRISEAMLAGDEGLARHRMRRHLAALTDWWHKGRHA